MCPRTRAVFVSIACCFFFLLASAANAQNECRELTGTGVGSDIKVPYYEPEKCVTPVTPAATTVIQEEENVVITPEPEQPVTPEEPAIQEPEPSVQEPAPAPEPEVQPEPAPAPVEETLPATAGELPLFALFGILSLIGAATVRVVAVRSRG